MSACNITRKIFANKYKLINVYLTQLVSLVNPTNQINLFNRFFNEIVKLQPTN